MAEVVRLSDSKYCELNYQVGPWAEVVTVLGLSAVNIHKSCIKGCSAIGQ